MMQSISQEPNLDTRASFCAIQKTPNEKDLINTKPLVIARGFVFIRKKALKIPRYNILTRLQTNL